MTEKTLTKKAQREQEQAEAQSKLRKLFPIGSTVNTVLRHVSSSGMSRAISVLAVDPHTGGISDVSYLVARATGDKLHPSYPGIKVGGAGMDMAFHLVYSLSSVLYRGRFYCTGEDFSHGTNRGCPANDHINERGDERAEGFDVGRLHSDAGYALHKASV